MQYSTILQITMQATQSLIKTALIHHCNMNEVNIILFSLMETTQVLKKTVVYIHIILVGHS